MWAKRKPKGKLKSGLGGCSDIKLAFGRGTDFFIELAQKLLNGITPYDCLIASPAGLDKALDLGHLRG